jgi:hypothetical protein
VLRFQKLTGVPLLYIKRKDKGKVLNKGINGLVKEEGDKCKKVALKLNISGSSFFSKNRGI